MATPLGIGYSRRGILASVAAAIGLVFAMNFLIHLFLALGEGDRVSPIVAAWTPNLIFFPDRPLPAATYARPTARRPALIRPSSGVACARMNPLADEWSIQHRAETCAVDRPALCRWRKFLHPAFSRRRGYRRQDLSEEAWQERNENMRPFSFWRARFEPPPPRCAGTFAKGKRGGTVSRRLVAAADRANANACYVLAAMLERKRVLKQIQTEEARSGSRPDL